MPGVFLGSQVSSQKPAPPEPSPSCLHMGLAELMTFAASPTAGWQMAAEMTLTHLTEGVDCQCSGTVPRTLTQMFGVVSMTRKAGSSVESALRTCHHPGNGMSAQLFSLSGFPSLWEEIG